MMGMDLGCYNPMGNYPLTSLVTSAACGYQFVSFFYFHLFFNLKRTCIYAIIIIYSI
jgi:hypothetical protein